jgi:DNA adenine methylase
VRDDRRFANQAALQTSTKGERIGGSTPVQPFLKWPGGKRWLVPRLLELMADIEFKTYFEPFAGGAALFFALRPDRAVLSDINPDLINTYSEVRNHGPEIVQRLMRLSVDQATYYSMRAQEPRGRLERAVRFLYLNRTAFAGIYRLNRQGHFNVPFGGGERSPSVLWERDLLRPAAQVLRASELLSGDFQLILQRAGSGDLIYCDPTYTVSHADNGFVRYNESNFRWEDQKRLAEVCRELRSRGATVVVSNASHPAVKSVFHSSEVHVFSRPSTVCPRPGSRKTVQEHVFVFRPGLRTRKRRSGA